MFQCAYRGTSQHALDVGGMCGGCNRSWYCCREHQVSDWVRHRKEHHSAPVQQQLIGWPMMLGLQTQKQGFELFKQRNAKHLPLGNYVSNNSRLVALCLWRCLTKAQKAAWRAKAGASATDPEALAYMHRTMQPFIADDDAKVDENQASLSDYSMSAQLWRIMLPEERKFYTDQVKDADPIAPGKTALGGEAAAATEDKVAKKARVDEPRFLSSLSYNVPLALSSDDERELITLVPDRFNFPRFPLEERQKYYRQLAMNNVKDGFDPRWKQLFYEDFVFNNHGGYDAASKKWITGDQTLKEVQLAIENRKISPCSAYLDAADHLAKLMANTLAKYTCGPVSEETYVSGDESAGLRPGSYFKVIGYTFALDWIIDFNQLEDDSDFGDISEVVFLTTERDPSVAKKRILPNGEREHLVFSPEFEEDLNTQMVYGRVHVIHAVEAIRNEILNDPRNSRALSTHPVFWKGVEELLIEKQALFANFFKILMFSGAPKLSITGSSKSHTYADSLHPVFTKEENDRVSVSLDDGGVRIY